MTTQEILNLVSKFTGLNDSKKCIEIMRQAENNNTYFYWGDATMTEIKSAVITARRQVEAMSMFTEQQLMKMCGMI